MGELPLFPLHTVLFPDGLLELKIFEARYLDLIASCLRERKPFGVVAMRAGSEARSRGDTVRLYEVGTIAELIDVDSAQAGILLVRCRGGERFKVGPTRQERDGLWIAAAAETVAADPLVAPATGHTDVVKSLADVIAGLSAQGSHPFLEPHRFDSAAWVANRWCEILPMAIEVQQRLLTLVDPVARLDVVVSLLRAREHAR
ncbi:MAG TPA: LON peptidase substrate-binding domain-containing protein [Caldimonas sp.]|jgi:hypothetical protein|nr:LON peptidase substrate-binding domain-containing protein [Caldimonas sp.]HEX4235877.1 LON peptidase substrate-binding domain-containing protein [Caldimonas sp.]